MTYDSLLNMVGDFVSLDISVQSTGWVHKRSGIVTMGTYKLKTSSNRERRYEFGEFLKGLLGDTPYDFIVIEDVIEGCNFETTRILTELNIVVEDIMHFGLIPETKVYRMSNMVWKKDLRYLCGAEKIIGVNDKEKIRFMLSQMNFNTDVKQDICDAMGLTLAWIYEHKLSTPTIVQKKAKELHTSLERGYKLMQYHNLETLQAATASMQKKAKKDMQIIQIKGLEPDSELLKDIFKDTVLEYGEDCIFEIQYNINRIGSILITKGFDVKEDVVYFTARR